MDNPFPSCKSQILVHYALSIGVENDAIEENNALIHLGEICCACSPMSGLFPHQILTICSSFHYDKLVFFLPFIANFKGTPSPKTQIAIKQKAPNQIFSFYQNQRQFAS